MEPETQMSSVYKLKKCCLFQFLPGCNHISDSSDFADTILERSGLVSKTYLNIYSMCIILFPDWQSNHVLALYQTKVRLKI